MTRRLALPILGFAGLKHLMDRARQVTLPNLVLSVWVLFTFAVAQPLLDLLGRNPEFFLARAAPAIDVILVALTVLVAIPGILALIIVVARAAHPVAGVIVHGLLFVVAAAALMVSIMERIPMGVLVIWLEIALGVVFGAVLWVTFIHSSHARTVFRYASLGPLVFLVMFLVFSPTAQLLSASGTIDRPAGVDVDNPRPVVMIVFDEFPVASLIDADGGLLEDSYPNFARLSRDGLWFRNAMGVEQQTEEAIPAILSGRHPGDRDAIPIAADYPLNMFSLLSDSYEIRAVESVTAMCPEYACENRSRVVTPAGTRWRDLGRDLSIVTAHLQLPSGMSTNLPSINQTWGDFANATPAARDDFNMIQRFHEYVDADRRSHVARFMEALERPSDHPTFYFAHLLLPHIPWNYLPTGQQYAAESPAPGSTPTGWGSDEWLVAQAYQRHLLQVQYTDGVVGEVISALESAGIYDETLLVIMADHGTADIPEVEHRRVITPETVGHIAAVPLFIKLPGMSAHGIDDYRAETTDVLPTVADILDLEVPWTVDGTSLVAATRPERSSTTMMGSQGPVTFDSTGAEKLAVARWKIGWFGSGDPYQLAPIGHRDLLGLPLASLSVVHDEALTFRLDHPGWYRDVDLSGDPFPSLLTGSVSRQSGDVGDLVLAIGLNGRIEAIARTHEGEGSTARFQAMLPHDAFHQGENEIDLILVEGRGVARSYHHFSMA